MVKKRNPYEKTAMQTLEKQWHKTGHETVKLSTITQLEKEQKENGTKKQLGPVRSKDRQIKDSYYKKGYPIDQ